MEPQPKNNWETGPAGRILVVDDEASVREFVRRALEYASYKVVEAQSPHEALQLMDQLAGSIDLVLTDVVMPGMSGRMMADSLLNRYPWLRVLFMSGNADIVRILKGKAVDDRHGVTLAKPFTPSVLIDRVGRALVEPREFAA